MKRQTNTDRIRHRKKQTDCDVGRQTYGQIESWTNTHRHIETETDKQIDRVRHTKTKTHYVRDRQTDRQIEDTQTN